MDKISENSDLILKLDFADTELMSNQSFCSAVPETSVPGYVLKLIIVADEAARQTAEELA